MSEIRLNADGEQALREAENLCLRMNIAIQAPEHLLGGALLVLAEQGRVPYTRDGIETAIEAIHSRGSEAFNDRVMPAPGMRMALNVTARAVSQAGGTVIDALLIARGTIASGEVNPMFYGALGTAREDLVSLLEA